jgi:D-glycero-D-manno-heptose 1,7-bisphosphate phosphatase
MTWKRLDEIHASMFDLLLEGGVSVDGVYVCPHTPDDGCECRKPRPGMARQAAAEHGFDLADAFVVGDHTADMQMGRAVGATTILLRTGHGEDELAAGAAEFADHVAADLPEAATVIGRLALGQAHR